MARKLHAGRPGGSQLNARTRAHTVRKVASSVPFKHEYERFFLFFSKQNEIGWSAFTPRHTCLLAIGFVPKLLRPTEPVPPTPSRSRRSSMPELLLYPNTRSGAKHIYTEEEVRSHRG